MTVIPITPEPDGQVELVGAELRLLEKAFAGTIVEVARDLDLTDNVQRRLGRLVTDALELGAIVLRNGQSRALVESVALEIDRLVATTSDESEKLPDALKQPLAEHLQRLRTCSPTASTRSGLAHSSASSRRSSARRPAPSCAGWCRTC